MSFNRVAGFAGLAGVLMWAISFIALPAPPSFAPPEDVRAFAADHYTALFVTIYTVDVLPALAFLTLGVGLWLSVSDEPGWATLGLVSAATLAGAMMFWGVTDGLLAVQGNLNANLGTIAATYQFYNAVHTPAHASIAALVLAFSVAGRRTGLLPAWTTPPSAFASVSALGVIPAGYIESGPLEAAHMLSIFAFLGWLAVASVCLLRLREVATTIHTAEPAPIS
jgi:hypothetical protein